MSRIAALSLALLALCLTAGAQLEKMTWPEDLLEFWEPYYEAKVAEDESAMDRLVRQKIREAEQALDYLLEQICFREDYVIEGEARTLAWSMDRVYGQERYIERVRLVTSLDKSQRRQRVTAILTFEDGVRLLEEARFARDEAGLAKANAKFESAARTFESLGDPEFACYTIQRQAEIARLKEDPEELESRLRQIVALGEQIPFEFDVVGSSEDALYQLEKLKESGETEVADVDLGTGEGGAGADADFSERSEEEVFTLEQKRPKKGMPSMPMPTVSPLTNDYLWPYTYVRGNGPENFDVWRYERFKPFGDVGKLTRDGAALGFDADGDGEVDVTFTPLSLPKVIELPDPLGGEPLPLLVSVPSDREQIFGADVNYSPQDEYIGRVRFQVASWNEGKILGKPWKIFDSNVSGVFGDVAESYVDTITYIDETAQLYLEYWEPDAVVIGKAKKAIPWSSILPVDGRFYRAHVSDNGREVRLRQLELETGKVEVRCNTAVQPAFLVIRGLEQRDGVYFDIMPVSKRAGAVEVPTGTYKIALGAVMSGEGQDMDMVRIYAGRSEPFTVTAGETEVLELGGPFHIDVRTRQEGETTTVLTRTMRVFGQSGEEYAMFYDDPLQPILEAVTTDGKKVLKPVKLQRTSTIEWSNNTGSDNVLWFPMEQSVENTKGGTLQVRMQQKKHKLLGGPFDTGWLPKLDEDEGDGDGDA